MFRRAGTDVQVLLVHPGGPFFRNKDAGAWTVPKGEAGAGEDLLTRAQIEFEEELGFAPPAAQLFELGSIRQKGGKTVFAWAFESDLPPNFELRCNSFEMEWPPRSGKHQSFPEVDQAQFFGLEEARIKINPAQIDFLDRLMAQLA